MRRRHSISPVAWLLLAACAPITVDSTSVPPASIMTSQPSPSQEPTATPSAEPTEAALGPNDVVVTTAEHVRVRESPGTAQHLIGVLPLGTVGFVLGDAVVVEGMPWYPLSGLGLPFESGCATDPGDPPELRCPTWRGWVAGASATGDPWLKRTTFTACPSGDLAGILAAPYAARLICFGDDLLSFTAYWPKIPADAGLGGACLPSNEELRWLICQNINYTVVTAGPDSPMLAGLRLSIDPASDVAMPPRGRWVEVTGHFDDPAAKQCYDPMAADVHPAMVIFGCRLEFVPTAVESTSAL